MTTVSISWFSKTFYPQSTAKDILNSNPENTTTIQRKWARKQLNIAEQAEKLRIKTWKYNKYKTANQKNMLPIITFERYLEKENKMYLEKWETYEMSLMDKEDPKKQAIKLAREHEHQAEFNKRRERALEQTELSMMMNEEHKEQEQRRQKRALEQKLEQRERTMMNDEERLQKHQQILEQREKERRERREHLILEQSKHQQLKQQQILEQRREQQIEQLKYQQILEQRREREREREREKREREKREREQEREREREKRERTIIGNEDQQREIVPIVQIDWTERFKHKLQERQKREEEHNQKLQELDILVKKQQLQLQQLQFELRQKNIQEQNQEQNQEPASCMRQQRLKQIRFQLIERINQKKIKEKEL